MGLFTYRFVEGLTAAEKLARRQALDNYGLAAQLSDLLPVVLILLYRLTRWVVRERAEGSGGGEYAAVPSSAVMKRRREEGVRSWGARRRRMQWWLGEDVVVRGHVYGQRDEWIVGTVWFLWLVLLSVMDTGEDYLHLTKRFGIVAVSQYPLQYLLALKSLNPFSYLLKSSHEQINRWHRVCARVTTCLLFIHGTLYLNFYLQNNRLHRLGVPIVLAGVIAFVSLNLILTTALRPIRRLSYRLFFLTHLTLATAIPLLILFHAPPARTFMLQTLLAFFVDLISRKLDTVTAHASVESIPGTNLIKLTATIPHVKTNRFRTSPGCHIYLSIPAAARAAFADPTSISHLLFEFLFNPFTVAGVSDTESDLTLIARHSGGPMTSALGHYAVLAKSNNPRFFGSGSVIPSGRNEGKVPVNIEGPYGSAGYFSSWFSGFDRILLVAGGVGATFAVPVYKSILTENPDARVRLVWSVRTAGEATWALLGDEGLVGDEGVEVYVTGQMGGGGVWQQGEQSEGGEGSGAEGTEMSRMFRRRSGSLGGRSQSATGGRFTSLHNRQRPDLRRVVDEVFGHGLEEKVAVVVCGPEEMARELREYVGVWVRKGRMVWWHKEGFGF
ncbi:putative ferric reductase transmembrane component [Triangularia verruculosa]|uniref:Ferric reductase transmembrane component n=1 Tax=Triangularia verruculosa TaxID=2587418 RepID=A0AAN7AW60_9PEZI|nr:putative ferric reductase transmembrane component [Triangularia verruculosa]